jgi:TRAP-type C4-dicarboxylate transport system permease small subunit
MRKKIDRIIGIVLVILLAAMTLDVLWGVLTRYAFGSQADWSEELARYLLIWIGILGAAYVAGQKMHLSIDLLLPKLKGANQKKLMVFIHLLVITFALAVMVIGGFRLIYITNVLGQLSASMRLPMYLVYSVLPLSGLLVIYYKIHDIFLITTKNQ